MHYNTCLKSLLRHLLARELRFVALRRSMTHTMNHCFRKRDRHRPNRLPLSLASLSSSIWKVRKEDGTTTPQKRKHTGGVFSVLVIGVGSGLAGVGVVGVVGVFSGCLVPPACPPLPARANPKD